MDHPVDAVSDDRLLQALEIEDVGEDVGTRVDHLFARLQDVGHDDVVASVFGAQNLGQSRAQLTQSTCRAINTFNKTSSNGSNEFILAMYSGTIFRHAF